ncbi:MAG: hypothetical protein AAGA31_15365 [Bacteroidota bacterium]
MSATVKTIGVEEKENPIEGFILDVLFDIYETQIFNEQVNGPLSDSTLGKSEQQGSGRHQQPSSVGENNTLLQQERA